MTNLNPAKYQNAAILLLAFGGPASLTDVEPFLKSVIKPRPVTNDQINQAKKRYSAIGGKSPLLDITKRQASSLQNELSKKYQGLRVYTGMRYWHPFIKEVLLQMKNESINKVITVCMAPQNSTAITGGYVMATDTASKELQSSLQVEFVESWHNKEGFLILLADRVEKALAEFEVRDNVHVIFSAHSLPLKSVVNDPYVEQLNETISGVLKLTGPLNHTLAYQSKGSGQQAWLGPDVEEVLEGLAQNNIINVLLVPIGFVSDHIETLYDIDIVFKNKALSLGLNFKRTPSFNDSPDFISFLAKMIFNKINAPLPFGEMPDEES